MESLADVHHNGDPYVWGNPKSSDVPVPAEMFVPAISPSAARSIRWKAVRVAV